MPSQWFDPVADWETLARVLFDPDDWDTDGLTPRALTTEDLQRRDRGWSAQRLACQPELLHEIVRRRRARNPALSFGAIAVVTANCLRQIELDDSGPAASIDADPLDWNDAHALVFGQAERKPSFYKALKERIIAQVTVLKTIVAAIALVA